MSVRPCNSRGEVAQKQAHKVLAVAYMKGDFIMKKFVEVNGVFFDKQNSVMLNAEHDKRLKAYVITAQACENDIISGCYGVSYGSEYFNECKPLVTVIADAARKNQKKQEQAESYLMQNYKRLAQEFCEKVASRGGASLQVI